LTSALPSDDNFRTSLLMTNLSARFSMLREQDDPNTKIGKASDDSVLFPKRQSRLADFGFSTGLGGLSDIAEVESIKAPFLRGQVDSYMSDDADSTKAGSVMNRAKPTEGNVLFGGRQKIYKIPVSASSSAKPSGSGAMAGRALYEDDVALSAFQLWRQTEKNRSSLGLENRDSTNDGEAGEEAEPLRSESPLPVGYNRKRETSSTTSSGSAIARYSTAATSVTSQPTSSVRESQPASTVPSSSTSTPVLERSVTRTRRLYEQALTQDMHDQQSSALSRIDTFGRQRPIGNRTPDLAQVSPSPTSLAFHDRFGERRLILTKGSAPNLRSLSPPATASSSGTMELPSKVSQSQPDTRNAFGGSPPLSPPISETGDLPMLPIQPNDHGKATAMGVFQKPAEPYDESKYAQRQLQLQQGRDMPNHRLRTESSASLATTGRSRSSSSMNSQAFESRTDAAVHIEPVVKDKYANNGTFLDDSDDSAAGGSRPHLAGPRVVLQRPADRDHPAFRETPLPTALSPRDAVERHPSGSLAEPDVTAATSAHASPPDSPTLGPTSGLSGMVRQHLRSESNTSSVYGAAPPTAGLDVRYRVDPHDSMTDGLDTKSNPWMSHSRDWNEPDSTDRFSHDIDHVAENDGLKESSFDHQITNDELEPETDEFASQLANARRRVRERLTSYVETDSSREGSPLRHSDPRRETAGQPPQVNTLGLGILKPKSSRGSLIDRSRTIGGTQSKAMKMLGIGAATMTSSPSPSKQSFDEKDGPLASMQEEPMTQEDKPSKQHVNAVAESELDSNSLREKEDENVHPGLRAFRQARRELQRRKELETLARHEASQASSTASESPDGIGHGQTTPTKERRSRQRTASRERKPPPIFYQQRAPSEESRFGQAASSHSSSRQTSTERDRSGSEASSGRSNGRPARFENKPGSYDDSQQQQQQQQQKQKQLGPNTVSRPPMLRSPGLPGTDIRRSPIMPPQGYPGSAISSATPSPNRLDRSRPATNLTLQPTPPSYESQSGQPSPISPLNGRMAVSNLTHTSTNTEVSNGLRNRSGITAGQSAPPLPPINPLRKREGSGTKGAPAQLPIRAGDDEQRYNAPNDSKEFRNPTMNFDPHGPYRGPGSRPGGTNNVFITAGPPASRTVLTPGLTHSNKGVPGGMF
jgi:hypothetical protein